MKKRKHLRSSLKLKTKKLSSTLPVLSYKITYKPLGRRRENYPEEVDKQMEELYDLVYDAPAKAIPRLIELKAKYPGIPELYNWLAAAQSETGNTPGCTATVKENYEKNHDYLFARINYAELCLSKKLFDEIPAIFDHKHDLSLLYPLRDTFHISEVVFFLGIWGMYYSEKGNVEATKQNYDILHRIAPMHDMTERLMLKLRIMEQ